jgi:hypothetical protein
VKVPPISMPTMPVMLIQSFTGTKASL